LLRRCAGATAAALDARPGSGLCGGGRLRSRGRAAAALVQLAEVRARLRPAGVAGLLQQRSASSWVPGHSLALHVELAERVAPGHVATLTGPVEQGGGPRAVRGNAGALEMVHAQIVTGAPLGAVARALVQRDGLDRVARPQE